MNRPLGTEVSSAQEYLLLDYVERLGRLRDSPPVDRQLIWIHMPPGTTMDAPDRHGGLNAGDIGVPLASVKGTPCTIISTPCNCF